MRAWPMRLVVLTAAALIAIGVAASTAGAAARGDVSVFALVGSPGYPALPHVVGDHVFEGTYSNPKGDSVPSKVFEYSDTGSLVRTFTVQGQDLSQAHGVQVAANDARGRLLLLDRTSGRIIRLDPETGAQTLYGQVPDLPLCSSSPANTPCKPETLNQPPMPDYAAWGPDGTLYVTDYQQAIIWRIPPGGGKAQIWFSSRLLDGGPFGTACIAMLPDHTTFLFDQASNGGLGGANPTTGKVYTIPIEPNGKPGALHKIWESGPADAPDGCALARSGHIYLALVGVSNQIVELTQTGQVLARFGQQYTGTNDSSVPFDSPSGLAFLGSELLIANQSYFAGDPANQAILALETGESGEPVYVPANAGLPPTPAGKGHKHHKKKRKHRRHKRKHKHRRHEQGEHRHKAKHRDSDGDYDGD